MCRRSRRDLVIDAQQRGTRATSVRAFAEAPDPRRYTAWTPTGEKRVAEATDGTGPGTTGAIARTVRSDDVLALLEHGRLAHPQLERAMQLAGCVPTRAGWIRQLDRLLAGLAMLLIVAGVACIVAYNWAGLGRWGRFGLAQAGMLALLVAIAWRGLASVGGRRLLMVAIALLGPLLALFGQTYQTGAETHDLLRVWALLAIPWVLASGYAPAWLLWLVLAEAAMLTMIFDLDRWSSVLFAGLSTWATVAALNLAALLFWEWGARRFESLAGRSGQRLIATVLVGTLTVATCLAFFSVPAEGIGVAPWVWLVVLGVGYYVYRFHRLDVAMLSLGWLSMTIVLLAGMGRMLNSLNSLAFLLLLIAAALIASSVLGRQWLGRIASGSREAG